MEFNENVKNMLNGVGCGFCLAKWTQVTMHLNNGLTHSCHHPSPHVIPLDELEDNPTALHNTRFKKNQRREMLKGKRPDECRYCWGIEDNSSSFSDRIFKSSEPWSYPYFDEVKELRWNGDYNPKYVEVNFSNACNFKCAYCSPVFSSKWLEEVEQFGHYPTSTMFNSLHWIKENGEMPFKHDQPNPYLDAFWKWWPDLYHDLDTFRITGGEPLLSKDTWDILDYIINEETPNKNLNIAINTNLGVSDKEIKKFIEKINIIENEERVNSFVIYTSVDGWGEQAEYIRFGLNFNRFWNNINNILKSCPTVTIGIMSTYNALSVPSFHKLIDGVYILKKEYASPTRAWTTPIALDCSYLRHPEHQTVRILPLDFGNQILTQFELASKYEEVFHSNLNPNGVSYGFTQMEIPKIKRIYDWMMSPQDEHEMLINRRDFYRFFNEYDRRRKTNFVKTFPELEDFYNNCKNIDI